MRNTALRTGLALGVILGGTLGLLYFGALAPAAVAWLVKTPVSGSEFVDARLAHQVVTLAIAVLVLALTAVLAPQGARDYFRMGDPGAAAQPVRWLGIKPGDTWKAVGGSFALIISLATAVFVYFNVVRGESLQPENVRLLPYVVVLAAMNAFTEEAITRLSVVAPLYGRLTRPLIPLASALIFGIPHFFGIPGGALGALMAGFMGWLLAQSILDTRGALWAWSIHFLQDVIIFGGLFVVAL